ncbi:hypothetical protein ABBQ32_009923 [Trebouxia sp. C0010 RCD-2024]
MADAPAFNIQPSSLTLGAVLARGSLGVVVYQAGLQLGRHVAKVAVKKLHTSAAPAAAEAAFLEEVQTLQLASAACQRLPYQGKTLPQMVSAMLKRRSLEVPASMPAWLQQVLQRCLSFDIAARPSVANLHQVLQDWHHQWLSYSAWRQQQAAEALSHQALLSQQNKDAIIAAGVVPPLVAMLRLDQPMVQQDAAAALHNLAKDSQQSRDPIIAAGALPPLVALLRSDQPAAQQDAAGALHDLAADSQQHRDAIIEAGAVPLLFAMLRSDQPAAQQTAADALHKLAQACKSLSAERGRHHCSRRCAPLVALLRSDQPAVQGGAAGALVNLAASSQQNRNAIMTAGAVPPLVAMLRADQPAAQQSVADALCNLAAGS